MAILIGGAVVGSVTAFDETAGMGQVAADDGRLLEFHCTQIVDGSRTVPVGTRVQFFVGAGGPGRWEAFDVRAL